MSFSILQNHFFLFACFFLDFRWWIEMVGHLAMFLVSDQEGHFLVFFLFFACDEANIVWCDHDAFKNKTRMCQQNKSWFANNMWTFNHKPWTIFFVTLGFEWNDFHLFVAMSTVDWTVCLTTTFFWTVFVVNLPWWFVFFWHGNAWNHLKHFEQNKWQTWFHANTLSVYYEIIWTHIPDKQKNVSYDVDIMTPCVWDRLPTCCRQYPSHSSIHGGWDLCVWQQCLLKWFFFGMETREIIWNILRETNDKHGSCQHVVHVLWNHLDTQSRQTKKCII